MILLVDDDPTSIRLLEMTMRRASIASVTARSGAEALSVIEGEPGIELVLTDYKMAGMNGVDLVERIRATRNGRRFVPIIMLTSQADRDTVASAVRAGVVDFIAKPIDPAIVLDRVKRIIAKGTAAIGFAGDTMNRLRLSEAEYRDLATTTLTHLRSLAADLDVATEWGDLAALLQVAARIEESAVVFGSARCLGAVRSVRAAQGVAQMRSATILGAALHDYQVALQGAASSRQA